MLTRTRGMNEEKTKNNFEDKNQMGGNAHLADPGNLDQRPVVGKDKKPSIFVPQNHPDNPGTDATSYLWRWRLE